MVSFKAGQLSNPSVLSCTTEKLKGLPFDMKILERGYTNTHTFLANFFLQEKLLEGVITFNLIFT